MANGKLGSAMTVAASYVTPYTVPASGVQFATIFICAVNEGGSLAKIRVGVTTSATPAASEFIAYEVPLDPNGGTFEYPCHISNPGEKVMVYADSSNVAVRVHGLEQVA